MVPLYENRSIAWDKLFNDSQTAHPGLLFDKFPGGWNQNWHSKLADGVKKKFFETIRDKYHSAPVLKQALENALEKQQTLLQALDGESVDASTDWRFVSGLGAAHPYETGFIWHRTLGVPYLPGSSVKGMVRAWAEQWGAAEEQEVTELFGPKQDNKDQTAACGKLIVFDALPVKPPTLEIDILNPHYSDYYKDPNTPPADYLSPVPVFFLTVAPRQAFRFFLAPRPGAYEDDVAKKRDLIRGKKLLSEALANLGAGGKTAVGYGQMTSTEQREQEQADSAQQWLDDAIGALRMDRDLRGQPEENLWKKALSERWRTNAPTELKQPILELIKAKWQELGISWEKPVGKSAQDALRNFTG